MLIFHKDSYRFKFSLPVALGLHDCGGNNRIHQGNVGRLILEWNYMLLKKLSLNDIQTLTTYLFRKSHRHHQIQNLIMITWYLAAPNTIFKLVQSGELVESHDCYSISQFVNDAICSERAFILKT